MAISASTNQLLLSENVFLILQEPLTFTAQFALNLHLWKPFLSILLLKTTAQYGFCRVMVP